MKSRNHEHLLYTGTHSHAHTQHVYRLYVHKKKQNTSSLLNQTLKFCMLSYLSQNTFGGQSHWYDISFLDVLNFHTDLCTWMIGFIGKINVTVYGTMKNDKDDLSCFSLLCRDNFHAFLFVFGKMLLYYEHTAAAVNLTNPHTPITSEACSNRWQLRLCYVRVTFRGPK